MNKSIIVLILMALTITNNYGQKEGKELPSFKTNRSEEDYSYLRDEENNPYKKAFLDDIKFIPLSKNRKSYLSLGGQIRPRVEHFTNRNWVVSDDSYYAHRLSFHADINLDSNIRFFVELNNGYKTGETELTQSDNLGIHQLFVAYKIPVNKDAYFDVRYGRQEMDLGASRLVSNRGGPNIRRSFDVGVLKYYVKNTTIKAYYGKETVPELYVFDNDFNLFNKNATNPELWSVGADFPIKNLNGNNQIYYLGFASKNSGFNDVVGKETRHSIGIRRFGTLNKNLSYNTEFVYQFGTIDHNNISAFNFETDWKYTFNKTIWRPILGIKLDWSSGDKKDNDGKINTFNPLFVNPEIYSLAAVNTPANLTSLHPSVTFFPFKGFSVYIDYATFYRTSRNDGLYVPTRFQARTANGFREKHLGDAFGFQMAYRFNRNLSVNLKSYYFLTGKFIQQTGPGESIFHIAPTLNFIF